MKPGSVLTQEARRYLLLLKQMMFMSATCGKTCYSVLFCGPAEGQYKAPFVVYKAKTLHGKWTENTPDGCVFGVSPSGWMMDSIFEDWFIKHFVKFVKGQTKPILLIYDGHGSHLTY